VSSIKSWASIEKKDGENRGRGDGETIKIIRRIGDRVIGRYI
jgi:hypothetical protein